MAKWPKWPELPEEEWQLSDEQLTEVFSEAVKVIRKAARKRTADHKGRCGFDSRYGMVKFLTYRLVVALEIRERATIIETYVKNLIAEKRLRLGRAPSFENNKFYWALLAVSPEGTLIDRHTRRTIGNELLYAFWRAVPPAYLLGFLYQISDGETIFQKIKRNRVEPWLQLGLLTRFPPLEEG